jgi:hypothetical protein
MRNSGKITLLDVLAIIGIIVVVAIWGFPLVHHSQEMTNRAVCMGNLGSINKGLIVYLSGSSVEKPWISNGITSWETAPVGTNRNRSPRLPGGDPNANRSVTAMMFMLVREGLSPKIFICPSDSEAVVDRNVQAEQDDGDVKRGEYYWDFSKPENVSYSAQAPRYINGGEFEQGIEDSQTDMVMVADMTPRYEGDKKWVPAAIADDTPQSVIKEQMSNNHQGEQVNVLKVAGNVKAVKRPDVGDGKDNIYTTYGSDFTNRSGATSTKLSDHTDDRDTFLIGPVGRSEAK